MLFHLINIRYKLSVIFQKLWHPGTRNRLNLSIMVVNLHQILSIGEVVDIDQIIGQKFKHSSTLNDSWWSIIFKVGTLSISLTSRNISTHQITNGNVWCIKNLTKNELSLWLYILGLFRQIIISFCKFLMPRPLKWCILGVNIIILSKVIHKDAGK